MVNERGGCGLVQSLIPPALPLCLLRYEEQVREQRNMIQKEDLSDMVAEHAAKQKVSLPMCVSCTLE